jgi:hypothetical protein
MSKLRLFFTTTIMIIGLAVLLAVSAWMFITSSLVSWVFQSHWLNVSHLYVLFCKYPQHIVFPWI